jgi:hypothetical protein
LIISYIKKVVILFLIIKLANPLNLPGFEFTAKPPGCMISEIWFNPATDHYPESQRARIIQRG